MSKILATFSGKFGDILWSLPTVRELSKLYNEPVDLKIMPQYKSLLPLLNYQPYIDKAEVIEDWACTGSPCGDQPWEPPKSCEEGYEHVHHLTYRQHPGMGCPAIPLADFTAWQQKIQLPNNTVPFISAQPIDVFPPPPQPVLCYGFNGDYFTVKQQFVFRLLSRTANLFAWLDVSKLPWDEAAAIINQTGVFVGCRSACWVVAMGVGAQTYTYEPNHSRHIAGPWGRVFGCSYGKEVATTLLNSPQLCADQIADDLLQWRDKYWKREKWDGRTAFV